MLPLAGERKFVNVDGVNTHYIEAGEAGRPSLLLFHGLGASVVTWRDNLDSLSRDFHVFAVDLPGHGDSDKPDIDYAPQTLVRIALGLVNALGLERPALVGNSVGGTLGLMMALDQPELFSGLVLVDCAGLGREVSWYVRLVSLPVLGQILESSRVGGTRYMLYNVFEDQRFVTEELLDELYRARAMPGAKEAVVRTVHQSVGLRGVRSKYVLANRLRELEMPLLLVWGAEDGILPVSHAYAAAAAAPEARLVVFERCGHWPHMERSRAFNALLLDFLLS